MKISLSRERIIRLDNVGEINGECKLLPQMDYKTERINAYSRVNEATGAINPLSEIT